MGLEHHNFQTSSLFIPSPHPYYSLSFHLPTVCRTQLHYQQINTSVSIFKQSNHPQQLQQKQIVSNDGTKLFSLILSQTSYYIDLIDFFGQFFHSKNNKPLHTLVESFQYILSIVPLKFPPSNFSYICKNITDLFIVSKYPFSG